jgi:drug/metabolite transporter (DMT)-like permease
VTRRDWTLMWLLALVWGASYLFIKVALEDMHPVFIVWGRLFLAGLVLVPLAIRMGAFTGLRGYERQVLFVCVMQIIAPFLLITFGEEHVASGLTGVLIASAPVFTALLVMRSPTERVVGWALVGVIVGMLGVGLLFGVDLTGTREELLGGTMILLASLGYSIAALYIKRNFKGTQPIGVAATTMTASAVLLTIPAAFHIPAAVPGATETAALVALGVLGTGLAFGIFYPLIDRVGANKSAVVAYMAPGFSVAYGALLLDEPITVGAIGGLVLILAGSWLAAEGRPPWRAKVAPPVPLPTPQQASPRQAAA